MNAIAEKIFETGKALPEQQAAEVLSFAESLKARQETEVQARREKALAILDKHCGLYDGAPFDRGELHERP